MEKITDSKINKLLSDLDADTEYIDEVVNNLVSQCCDKLDTYVKYVFELLNAGSNNITNAELDDIIMTIPSLLYFCGSQQEMLGIKQDMSQASKQVDYNDVYMETVGTDGYRKAVATNKVTEQTITTIIYGCAYNVIKQKVSYATELLQSAKKVVSRRMAELDLSKVNPS